MASYQKLIEPKEGSKIKVLGPNKFEVPSDPIIPFIEGDGIGADLTRAMHIVINAAVKKAYDGKKKINWLEIYAGEKAVEKYGEGQYLPKDTITALKEYSIGIKGPITTPVGGGFRSLNVTIRQVLDLFACVRPVKYYEGIPSPVKHPEKVNMIIFRENTEDIYAGIEFRSGSEEAKKLRDFLISMDVNIKEKIREDAGIGIKPMGPFASKRLIKKAIQYAIDNGKTSVTLVHKGNIMKFTEGAFRDWGYELAKTEFGDKLIPEAEVTGSTDKIIIKDRIADSMFQQGLLRPDEYSVLALPNLTGDFMSDALAAQVGGLGMAPGANMSDTMAIFEATHGSAPKYTNQDKANPGSLILSAVMMLIHMGWKEAADLVEKGIKETIKQKYVTYDLARQMTGVTEVKCSQFAERIAENM
ncbi:isocitrate dehydrogenase (NADP(+)) [Candidatus Acidulodesulfobacterium sp. H_13]|uniref:isocitrate dehydrogenase (NADP(+)) n=1 Tax=Candidatus Acidulodesulfobacterium sp. H_13 TaxID=3395470 RepID=UPI003AF64ED5